MDRIDAMRILVAALDEGSLAAAGRRLGRSASTVTRAINALEREVGGPIVHRTTRSLRPSETGEAFIAQCRRILEAFDEATSGAVGDGIEARGVLALTAPVAAGAKMLRPVLDEFLTAHPAVSGRMLLLDRVVSLVDEGLDVALRIGHLPDSSLVAVRLGEVRKVLVASPAYLESAPPILGLSDLEHHRCIEVSAFGQTAWSFRSPDTGGSRHVSISPRLIVNAVDAAIDSAVEGGGLTRVFCYQASRAIHDGRLRIVLPEAEPPPTPVHLVTPQGRLALPKVRSFFEFAVPRLRRAFRTSHDLCVDL